jgi:hypothetical protein
MQSSTRGLVRASIRRGEVLVAQPVDGDFVLALITDLDADDVFLLDIGGRNRAIPDSRVFHDVCSSSWTARGASGE